MLNIVALQGRFTADPEIRTTQSGNAVCSFTLAVESNYGEKTTYFIDCVAWRNTAEFVGKYFRKGQLAAVDGSLTTRSWEDKQGNKRKSTEINVNSVHFCGKSESGKETERNGQFEDIDVLFDDDLPFK